LRSNEEELERAWGNLPYTESSLDLTPLKASSRHTLRRYCASYLVDTHKISAKTIQRTLRHKSFTTKERYIQNVNGDFREVVNRFSENNLQDDPPRVSEEG
jgi:hypothetical protein